MKALVLYTAGRFVIFAALGVTLYLVGLRGFLLFAVALLLSVPVSWVVLSRQRAALTSEVDRRVEGRRDRKQEFRAKLRGDDDT